MVAVIKRGRGRPKGSGMNKRVTIRIPDNEYYYLAGQADSHDHDSVARIIRRAIRFYMAHSAGKRLPENTDTTVKTVGEAEDASEEEDDNFIDLSSDEPAEPPIPVNLPELASFDSKRFVLGNLCKRGHVWHGTDQQTLYRLPNMACPQCDAIRAKEYRKNKKNIRQS